MSFFASFFCGAVVNLWFWSGVSGTCRSRHKGGGASEKNYRLDNRANIKEIQAQNRQARKLRSARSCVIPRIGTCVLGILLSTDGRNRVTNLGFGCLHVGFMLRKAPCICPERSWLAKTFAANSKLHHTCTYLSITRYGGMLRVCSGVDHTVFVAHVLKIPTDPRDLWGLLVYCLLYTSPSPRDRTRSRMPSSA